MLHSHLLLVMLRAHLLIHCMRSVSGASVFGHFAGVRFRLVTLKVLPVAVKIFGLVFVLGLALSFSRSARSSEFLSTFAVLVALIK